MGSRPVVWLGEVSFGFYLVQGVTIFYLRRLLDGATYAAPVAILVIIGFFSVSLLGGWLLFRFVESPMMRHFSRSHRRDRDVRAKTKAASAAMP